MPRSIDNKFKQGNIGKRKIPSNFYTTAFYGSLVAIPGGFVGYIGLRLAYYTSRKVVNAIKKD